MSPMVFRIFLLCVMADLFVLKLKLKRAVSRRIKSNSKNSSETKAPFILSADHLMTRKTSPESLNPSDLDSLMAGPRLARKASHEQSDETPIWNKFELIWEESDKQFQNRIKGLK